MAIDDAAHAALVRLRRELHTAPEVGLNLPDTQQKLLNELDGLPLNSLWGAGAPRSPRCCAAHTRIGGTMPQRCSSAATWTASP